MMRSRKLVEGGNVNRRVLKYVRESSEGKGDGTGVEELRVGNPRGWGYCWGLRKPHGGVRCCNIAVFGSAEPEITPRDPIDAATRIAELSSPYCPRIVYIC